MHASAPHPSVFPDFTPGIHKIAPTLCVVAAAARRPPAVVLGQSRAARAAATSADGTTITGRSACWLTP